METDYLRARHQNKSQRICIFVPGNMQQLTNIISSKRYQILSYLNVFKFRPIQRTWTNLSLSLYDIMSQSRRLITKVDI